MKVNYITTIDYNDETYKLAEFRFSSLQLFAFHVLIVPILPAVQESERIFSWMFAEIVCYKRSLGNLYVARYRIYCQELTSGR